VAKITHEFMDIDVLCDAKMSKTEARLIKVESTP